MTADARDEAGIQDHGDRGERGGARLAGYFGTESMRTGEQAVSCWLPVRADLADEHGRLQLGPVAYAVDMGTGLAMGLAVLAHERWVITTDLDVRMTTPVTTGPVRVDAEVVRAGATTVVSAFTLTDEGTDRRVGGGTATGRPFPFEFDLSILDVAIGVRVAHPAIAAPGSGPLTEQLGFRVAEGGAVEVDVAGWLRNPWGILHGGVTSCLVDVAAQAAGRSALGPQARVAGTTVRFLAPGRVGPARAVPRLIATSDREATIEVRVTDGGAQGRLMVVATATVVAE